MSRKRTRMYEVNTSEGKGNRPLHIDMNKMNLKKEYHRVTFRTGQHVTVKDRPRQKRWDPEE